MEVEMVHEVVELPEEKQIQVPMITMVHETLEVPQTEYVDYHMRDFVLKFVEVPQVEFVDHHMRVFVLKFMEVPQAEFVDTVVEEPIQQQVQVPMVTMLRKAVEVLHIEYGDNHNHIPEKPVVDQELVEVPQFELVDGFVEVPIQEQLQVPMVASSDTHSVITKMRGYSSSMYFEAVRCGK
eukprot:15442297-Alexandrium_andersonii.AAC.1